MISALNHEKEGKSTRGELYTSYISGERNPLLKLVLKMILGCFLAFIILHYYVYKLLLLLMAPINKICGFAGYTPLILVQNQMIFKCRLITS